ncbi:MAG: carbohydrate-binding family 9-like protein [Anaerolineales bacterium]
MALPEFSDDDIAHYTCYRTQQPLTVDGHLSEPAWQCAPKSPRFVDMVTGDPAFFDTRAAALWDDENFYVAFWIEEPFVEAHLTERDSLIFMENDVEVFIDGGDCYYEFEINARNTVYEVFFIWQDAYTHDSKFDVPEFDLLGRKALSFAGNYDRSGFNFWWGTHPRQARWAFVDWDLPGMRSAVQVEGKLNDRAVISKGWTVELAFPWAGMQWLANGRSLPPKDGDVWSVFFGRFEKLEVANARPEPQPAWCWNKHGALDTHMPERFTRVHFSTQTVEDL